MVSFIGIHLRNVSSVDTRYVGLADARGTGWDMSGC